MVNMNLTGEIPHEISYLTHLTTLDLSSNNLKGSLPEDLFSMRSLKHLYLDKNQLTDSLSPSIGSMTKLESLFLGENEFTGQIPETLPSSLRKYLRRQYCGCCFKTIDVINTCLSNFCRVHQLV
jgi:Leucine-rich repeat (LRR) protein